jgi:hypothetical protein
VTYFDPGVYDARVRITDDADKMFEQTATLVVHAFQEVDAVVRGAYLGMVDRLRAGDTAGALNAVTATMRDKYQKVFNALGAELPQTADQIGTLDHGVIGRGLAEYLIVRKRPDGSTAAFPIYFLRSEDGVWRIDGM